MVAEPARVRQLGQRGGQRDPGRQADGGLDRAGHDDRQPDPLGDLEGGAHPAERRHLEHGDVGGVERDDPVGVLGPPDRLVRGDRHRAPGPGQPDPQRGQVLDGRARLLDVLEVEAVERPDGAFRRVEVPAAVRVDPEPAGGTERVAHRLAAGQVVGEGLAPLGDLDLGRAGSPRPRRSRAPARARPPARCS